MTPHLMLTLPLSHDLLHLLDMRLSKPKLCQSLVSNYAQLTQRFIFLLHGLCGGVMNTNELPAASSHSV